MKNLFVLLLILISVKAISQDEQTKGDWANLKKYAFENNRLSPPRPGEKRIVFLGNSITEVWKSKDSSFFSNRPYLNRGIGGQTTAQMVARFQQDVIDLKPAVVVILAGINDIAENEGPIALEDVYGNIVSMVELAVSNNIQVVVSSILPANYFPWRPALKPAEKVIALNAMLQSYCKTHGIVYLDYYSKMVNDEKGLDKDLAEDGVHPTLAGYAIMEPLVEKAIAQALKKK